MTPSLNAVNQKSVSLMVPQVQLIETFKGHFDLDFDFNLDLNSQDIRSLQSDIICDCYQSQVCISLMVTEVCPIENIDG